MPHVPKTATVFLTLAALLLPLRLTPFSFAADAPDSPLDSSNDAVTAPQSQSADNSLPAGFTSPDADSSPIDVIDLLAGEASARQHDFTAAMTLYAKAADAGNPDAMFYLGSCYAVAPGVTHDYALARQWLDRSAAAGNSRGMLGISALYSRGLGIPRDLAQAATWCQKAANAGNSNAMLQLAAMYQHGQGVPHDDQSAIAWYTKAADAGNTNAMVNLAGIYKRGAGVPVDFAQALAWYQKAAKLGNTIAVFDIGVMYEYGNGVPKDLSLALRQFQTAADAGQSDAMFTLARLYFRGQGVPLDKTQAYDWLEKAAKAGNARAMFDLAMSYHKGVVVPHDDNRAVFWLQHAARAGYPDAMTRLGALVLSQHTPDYNLALRLFKSAAAAGNLEACERLGIMYHRGQGVPVDDQQASLCWQKAIAGGRVHSLTFLGALYFSGGKDIPKDPSKAVSLFQQGASHQDPDAMCGLGLCYLRGTGVPRDVGNAINWLTLAAAKGSRTALATLKEIQHPLHQQQQQPNSHELST